MYQHCNKLKMYKINSRNVKGFKPSEVSAIVISHLHLDHYSLACRLYKLNCKAKVYVPKGSLEFFKCLFKDNLNIMKKDSEYLSKIEKKEIPMLYNEEDVDNFLSNIVEVDFNDKIKITDNFQLKFSPAYHIINSAQVELFVRDKGYNKKIYYSGDIGNLSIKNKPFLNKFKQIKNCDIAIVENTYAMNKNICDSKVRKREVSKLEETLKTTCIDNKSNVILASFSMQRTQELMVDLDYVINNNSELNGLDVYIDSPLANSITKAMLRVLENGNQKDKLLLERIVNSSNFHLINEWEDTLRLLNDRKPKVIISCSGFCEGGKIRLHLAKNLSNPKATIVFCGYSSSDSLSGFLKDSKNKGKEVKIDEETVKYNCNVVIFSSYTSHIQHYDMLKYYGEINCKQIYLVHSQMSKRLEFAEELEEEYKLRFKSNKVYVATRGLKIEV